MRTADVLADAFGRVREVVHQATDGLTAEQAAFRPDPDANSIAWLIWHLSRIQDDHVAEVAGTEQVWTAKGWAGQFGLPFGPADTGWGHDADQVGAVRIKEAELLIGYHDGVFQATLDFVAGVTEADLDKVVDERWVPPVTLGVRLVSVISDNLQHAGQAAYLRGVIMRS